MGNILLKIDKEFFFKMKEDKAERERKLGKSLTWEVYIALLFGIARRVKII